MSALEKFIEEKWGFSKVKVKEVLQMTGEREVFCLNTSEDVFVVKLYHPELTKAEIKSYTDVLVFLENSGFHQAPRLMKMADGCVYSKYNGRYLFIMEFIQGRQLTEDISDEFSLGATLAQLHEIRNYRHAANIDTQAEKKKMLSRFDDYWFKEDYDRIVQGLPDFNKTKQCFIHTDICPSNGRMNLDGEIILIDFDDAGNGSPFIDVGYPLIAQFVKYRNRIVGQNPPNPEDIYFDNEAAKAFYEGYLSKTLLSKAEKQLVFDGAVFMQLMYMPVFGGDAIPFLWKVLDFALKNKDILLNALELES